MNRNHLTVKPHIFTFYHIISKAFFFLIFPFFQQIFLHPESIWQKVTYTIFNVLFITALAAIIFFEYKEISYIQSGRLISFEKGLFHHNKLILPTKELTAISVSRSVILFLANCNKVYLSSSTCFKTRRIELYTSAKAAKNIINFNTSRSAQNIIYKSRILAPALMALTQSNAMAGIFALAVIFKRLSTLLGEQLTELVLDSINIIPRLLAISLPPTFAYTAGIIFAGFLFGLLNQLIINANFSSFYNEKFLFVFKGFIKKSILCVNKSLLNGVLIKQSMLMRLTQIYTLSVLYTGIQEDKNSGVYVPVAFGNNLQRYVSTVMPVENYSFEIKPPKGSLKSYLVAPTIFIAASSFLCIAMYNSFDYSFITRFTAIVLLPFGFLWLWFRLLAGRHCGVSIGEKTIKINYHKRLNLMVALVYKSKVTKAVVSQNPWQQIFGSCHLILYICGKRKMSIKVKHLKYCDVVKLVEREFN